MTPITLSNRTLYMNQVTQTYQRCDDDHDDLIVQLSSGELLSYPNGGDDAALILATQDAFEDATRTFLKDATNNDIFTLKDDEDEQPTANDNTRPKI